MASWSCPPILVPETRNCSGHGICIDEFSCFCEPGFTGLGDFAFRETAACGINIAAVSSLWGILAAFHFIELLIQCRFLNIKYGQRRRTDATPLTTGILFAICNICFIVTGVIRATRYDLVIGTNPLVTFFFSSGTASFWTGAHVFAYQFIILSLKQVGARNGGGYSKSRSFMLKMRMELTISAIISIFACYSPMFMLIANDSLTVRVLSALHYLVLAFELTSLGLLLIPRYVNIVSNEISENLSKNVAVVGGNESMNQILVKLNRFVRELQNQAISNAILACLMGFWPLLNIVGSSYFLPFAWFSSVIVIGLSMYVNWPVGKNGNSTNSKLSDGTLDDINMSSTKGQFKSVVVAGSPSMS